MYKNASKYTEHFRACINKRESNGRIWKEGKLCSNLEFSDANNGNVPETDENVQLNFLPL